MNMLQNAENRLDSIGMCYFCDFMHSPLSVSAFIDVNMNGCSIAFDLQWPMGSLQCSRIMNSL